MNNSDKLQFVFSLSETEKRQCVNFPNLSFSLFKLENTNYYQFITRVVRRMFFISIAFSAKKPLEVFWSIEFLAGVANLFIM